MFPSTADENYLSRVKLGIIYEGSRRLPQIALGIVKEFLRLENWSLFWPLVLFSLILAPKVKLEKCEKDLLLILGLHISLYIFVYMIAPWQLEALLRISLTRLLMHMVPLWLIFVAGVFFRLWATYLKPVKN
jgi:hypothetical protein